MAEREGGVMKCKKCEHLTTKTETCLGIAVPFDWCDKINDNPYRDKERVCEYYETKTNADRIRNMNDEELAKHISCPQYFIVGFRCKADENEGDCYKCTLNWLKEKVE